MKKTICAAVEVRGETIQKTLEHLGCPMVSISIQHPVVSGKIGRQALGRTNRYYSRIGKKFLIHCTRRLLPEAIADFEYKTGAKKTFSPNIADMHFTVTHNDHGILSLYWDVSETIRDITSNAVRYSDTWSLQNGFFLTLPQFYPRGISYRDSILETILKQADQDPRFYYSNNTKLFRKHFSTQNFYLTDSGLSLYYQMHTIVPQSFCTFIIPYNHEAGPFLPEQLFHLTSLKKTGKDSCTSKDTEAS